MFQPEINKSIIVEDKQYFFDAHPLAPSLVYGQEGRHGIVYRLRNIEGEYFGLKVFHSRFQNERNKLLSLILKPLSSLPGMCIADRIVLTEDNAPNTIEEHPELAFSILMPWINGDTFLGVFLSRKPFTLAESVLFATQVAVILSTLEKKDLAHSDISSSNVLLDYNARKVWLVGLDNLYGEDFPKPIALILGTPGYARPSMLSKDTQQWCREGDRFAGAILIAELLAWFDPNIRSRAYGESFFSSGDFEQPANDRLELLNSSLMRLNPKIANLLKQVWAARTLANCPPLRIWRDMLEESPHRLKR